MTDLMPVPPTVAPTTVAMMGAGVNLGTNSQLLATTSRPGIHRNPVVITTHGMIKNEMNEVLLKNEMHLLKTRIHHPNKSLFIFLQLVFDI